MNEKYLAWLQSTGRVAAGTLLIVVAAIAVYGTKQWAGLVFVVIGAVSVWMGVRTIRQRKRDQSADSKPDSQPTNSEPAGQPGQ